MKYENCKDCAYCEYHDEIEDGVEYKGYYCGGFEYLTDNARLENIEKCEYAESELANDDRKCPNCGCKPEDEPYCMDGTTHCPMCGYTFK